MRHDRFAGGYVHHVGTHTHDAAARDGELEVHTVVDHLHLSHLAFVRRDELDDLSAALFRCVHRQALHRFAFHTVDLFDDHLRLTYLQFVALATHRLDEHAQMQHTATIDAPGRFFRAFLHAQRQVLLQLFVEAILDMTACDVLAVLSEERTVVDAEGHTHRRLVDSNRLECLGVLCVADGVANLKTVDTDHRADIAILHHVGLHMTHTGEGMQLFDLGLHHRAVFLRQRHHLSVLELTAVYTTDGDSADVAVIVQRSHEHLRRTRVLFRRGDVLDDSVHEVGEVGGRLAPVGTHPALFGRSVQRLKIQLVVRRIEVAHQVEYLFLYLVRTAVEFIYFVDHHDGLQTQLQGFLQHEACLRHRPLEGINQQQHTVCHV